MKATAALSLLATIASLECAQAAPVQDRSLSARADSAWNPPSNISAALDSVWSHTMSTYSGDPLTFKNYGYDHIIDTKGNVQYCVRWDSVKSVTAAQRTSIASQLQKMYQKWVTKALAGFDGFPYSDVNVTVVGWATNNTALLEGSTDGVTVYSDTADVDGIPECDPACGRAIHYADGDYSGCAGGDAARYGKQLLPPLTLVRRTKKKMANAKQTSPSGSPTAWTTAPAATAATGASRSASATC